MFSFYIKNLISIAGAQTLPSEQGEIWSLEVLFLLRELR